ncbi:FAD-dependent monooxygenase [Colwellia sp. 1_MG-2023]|uniref:FAD-dependent oxidoreductase n=1 Tax=Colwellia sp. 1_MG-2023 TaxID=3062649 RepID=UPI0026E30A85|nr:FAD-dependent oxidoreductase [Colwellia sp. 1_MG-2023]MDO6447539.1 FAD-dependent monooxygenase [Colwellia sp. 1_MG-2023]
MDKFDCVVVGGGMVGAASALSIAELGLKVAVIEKSAPTPFLQNQPFDLRVSAISLSSQFLLEQLNAWQQIKQWRVCPYRRLSVWELESAYTEFSSAEINEQHLGHIVENRLIQLSLWQQINAHENIALYCPESLFGFEQNDAYVSVQLSSQTIETKLLIAADGANSQVRQLANIGTTGWDYQQAAMLINVETELNQQDITWQHFRESGPVAMLPMLGHHASLVWYHDKEEISRLSNLSNEQLQSAIIEAFPAKLGKINVIDKASFPLTRRHANQYQNQRVVLVGDAAHTINPLAGQGVNLGFKDVKALQELLAKAIGEGKCWHDIDVLAGYEKARRRDNLLMMSAMDMLYSGFSHPSSLIKILRNTGLFMANKLPSLKSKALAYACGI